MTFDESVRHSRLSFVEKFNIRRFNPWKERSGIRTEKDTGVTKDFGLVDG